MYWDGVEKPTDYHMVQNFDEGKIDETDKFLVICQTFVLAIANVVPATVSPNFYSLNFS